MDLQMFRSSPLLTHPLQVCPNHSLTFFIQVILGLPCPLFPSILPSSNNFWIDLALITCPKYWHFLFFIVGHKELVVFAILKIINSLVLCSVHDTHNILLYAHISNPSNLLSMILVFTFHGFGRRYRRYINDNHNYVKRVIITLFIPQP